MFFDIIRNSINENFNRKYKNTDSNRVTKTVNNVILNLNWIKIPKISSDINMVSEIIISLDDIPVAKTRQIFIENKTISVNEIFEFTEIHNFENLKITINKFKNKNFRKFL